eukprot:TRINITY_DN17156_c0_g1_i2.p2 TRINITY_DN17156_c0_g1~~TRINITY_DN17156_c0_g1_i2.p2  ORF type:complete len:186 (+),score=41.70 TRINITY_DN17156_c0_g1_i2:181-738(+)
MKMLQGRCSGWRARWAACCRMVQAAVNRQRQRLRRRHCWRMRAAPRSLMEGLQTQLAQRRRRRSLRRRVCTAQPGTQREPSADGFKPLGKPAGRDEAIRKEATAVGAAAEKAAKEAQSEISHVEELSRGAAKAHEEVARKKVLEAMALEKMQMTTARVSDLKKRSTLAQQVVERAEQAAARSRRN